MPAAVLCKSFLITNLLVLVGESAQKSLDLYGSKKANFVNYQIPCWSNIQIKSWDVEYSIQSQLFYFILNSPVSLPDFLINHLTLKIKNETIPSCITDYVCNSFVLYENQWKWSKMREEMIEFEVGQCLLHRPPAFDVNLYHFTLIGWSGCHVTTGPVLLLTGRHPLLAIQIWFRVPFLVPVLHL